MEYYKVMTFARYRLAKGRAGSDLALGLLQSLGWYPGSMERRAVTSMAARARIAPWDLALWALRSCWWVPGLAWFWGGLTAATCGVYVCVFVCVLLFLYVYLKLTVVVCMPVVCMHSYSLRLYAYVCIYENIFCLYAWHTHIHACTCLYKHTDVKVRTQKTLKLKK